MKEARKDGRRKSTEKVRGRESDDMGKKEEKEENMNKVKESWKS